MPQWKIYIKNIKNGYVYDQILDLILTGQELLAGDDEKKCMWNSDQPICFGVRNVSDQ